MSNNSTDTTSIEQKPSVLRQAVITGVFFILAYVITQRSLFDDHIRQQVSETLISAHQSLCTQGIRFPGLPCQSRSIIKKDPSATDKPFRQRFARLPNLSAAIDKLEWLNGTEEDAVRLLTIIRTLELGRQRQSRENHEAIPAITKLLKPVWRRYPHLIAASSCIYCGNGFDVLSNLMESTQTDVDTLRALSRGHPRLLTESKPENIFSAEELYEIAAMQGVFSSPGDAKTSEFIGSILLRNADYERLKIWVRKGLNGGRSLAKVDLDTIPLELTIAAWEQGVRSGYDQVQLTRYLVAHGYRPALRWLVSLESTDYEYIHGWNYQRASGQYQAILNDFTRFPTTKGDALAAFYSEQWRNIIWLEREKRWGLIEHKNNLSNLN